MSRLILTENVNRVIQKAFDDGRFSIKVGQYLMDRIAEIPDGLVRCKDCKFYWKNGGDCVDDPNWFCADGVRKDADRPD